MIPLLLCLVTADTLDLNLDQALSLARRESPTYADARLDSADGQNKFLTAWSNVLPNLSASAGLGWSNSRDFQDTTKRTTSRSWSLSGSASQVIFNAGVLGGVAQGYVARRLSQLQSGNKINTLLFNVKTGYYGLQKVYGLLEVGRDAVQSAEDNYKLAEVKLRLGKATGLEVLRARTNLSQARLNLMNAETGLLTASEAFKAVIGVEGDVVIRPEAVDSTLPAPAFASLEEYWNAVADANSGLQLARQGIKAAELGRTVAYGALLPSLAFSISNRYGDEDLPGKSNPWGNHDATSFGFSLGLPILDVPGVVLGIKSARLAVDRAEVAQRLAEIQTRQSAVSAWLNYEQSSRQVGFAAENLRLNQELYRLGQEQYRLGQITQLDLFAMETGLTQARTSYLNAVSDVHSQQAQIDYLLGR